MKRQTALIFLVLVYLFTRFVKFNSFPVFIDEAFYLHLGYGIKSGDFALFEALKHGNPPFFSWYLSVILYLLPLFDPFVIGRLFSLISGLLVVIELFLIGKKHFNIGAGFLSSLTYIILPFSLIYNSLTLIEPLTALFGISLFGLLLESKQNLKTLIAAGILLGTSLITKSSAYFYIVLVLLFKPKKSFSSVLLIFFISLVFWSVILFHPNYPRIAAFNNTFTASLGELVNSPFEFFYPNFIQTVQWLLYYFGLGLIIVNFFGFLYFLKNKNYIYLKISVWIVLVIIVEILIAKIYYPRYFFFITPFLSLTTGTILDAVIKKFKSVYITIFILLVIFIQPIYNSFQILTDVNNTSLPQIERWQLLEGWPSGYGFSNVLNFISKIPKTEKTELIVEKYGLPYFMLYLYYGNQKHILISSNLSTSDFPASDISNKYIIINQLQELPKSWPVQLIYSYPKVNNKNSIFIYKIINND